MAGVGDLGKVYDPSFRRDRKVTAHKRNEPSKETADQRLDEAAEVLDNSTKLVEKADTLLKEVYRIASRKVVPVRPDAIDVRAAVARRSPESQGRFINMDLYREALRILDADFEALETDIYENLPRDPSTATTIVTARVKSKAKGLDMKDALYMGGQAMTLLVHKLLNKGADNLDAQGQTSTKQPAGSETASVVLSIAISQVVRLLVTNLLEEDLEEDTGDFPSAIPVDSAAVKAKQAEAQAILEGVRAYNLTKVLKEDEDYLLIKDYVQGFLATVQDMGWEEWMFIPDIQDIKMEATAYRDVLASKVKTPYVQNLTQEERQTSEDWIANSDLGFLVDNQVLSDIKGSLTSSITNELDGPIDTQNMPDDTTTGIFKDGIDMFNRSLNKIASVLAWKELQDALCCFIRLMGGMDLKSVKTIRKVLQASLASSSFNFDYNVSSQYGGTLSLGRKAAAKMLADIVEGYNKFVDQIWSYVSELEHADDAFACTPVDEMFNYIADWAKNYLDKATSYVLKYVDVMVGKKGSYDLRIKATANMKKVKWYIAMIDQLLAAIDKGELCKPTEENDSLGSEDLERVTTAIVNNLPSTIVLPKSDDPFKSFSLEEPIDLGNGIKMGTEVARAPDGTKVKLDHEECRKKVSGDSLIQFDAYLRRLGELEK